MLISMLRNNCFNGEYVDDADKFENYPEMTREELIARVEFWKWRYRKLTNIYKEQQNETRRFY